MNQILMGARTYLPELGIFTATDPIEGGNTTPWTCPHRPSCKPEAELLDLA
ncbi:MAG: hypothetical protein IPH27_08060 [Actinomycetales bacterium]|nr:hypothetical protein [Candidatus Phosphoribacter baldrii]